MGRDDCKQSSRPIPFLEPSAFLEPRGGPQSKPPDGGGSQSKALDGAARRTRLTPAPAGVT